MYPKNLDKKCIFILFLILILFLHFQDFSRCFYILKILYIFLDFHNVRQENYFKSPGESFTRTYNIASRKHDT